MKRFLLITVIAIAVFSLDVTASSFTDSYSDFGLDTNSDGLFEYLVVNASISITTSGDYSVFGELSDSSGNIQEYDNCTTLSTGTIDFPLKFSGTELYLNGVDGPYNLSYIELNYMANGCGGQPPAQPDDSRDNPYTTKYYSYTEFQPPPMHPAIYCIFSPCTAPSSLISCAGNDEPNAPNTIDGCIDGDSGACHVDESIENITITALDNIFIGDNTIHIEIWAYCSTGDNINFVYTNNSVSPQWRIVANSFCSTNGYEKHSTSFALDDVEGNHTIRTIIQSFGSPSATCGNGQYDDNDDVTVYVHRAVQNINISLNQGWNLVSIPLILSNKTISNVFGAVNYSSIYTYENGNYVLLNENDEIDLTKGYWINMNNTDILELEGTIPSYPIMFDIKTGWNLIGYSYLYDTNINDSLSSLNPIIQKVNMFDNGWKTYGFNKPSVLNSLQSLKSKYGYWVYSDMNIQLEFSSGIFSVYNPIRTINFNLKPGWNLISIPLNLSNNTVANTFKNINYTEIYSYNNSYILLNENSIITPEMGLWINMNSTNTLTITGKEVINPVINLKPGWNLVGYPKLSQKSIILYYNKDEIENVLSYIDKWYSYNPKKLNKLNSLKLLKPGKGYWVHSNSTVSISLS